MRRRTAGRRHDAKLALSGAIASRINRFSVARRLRLQLRVTGALDGGGLEPTARGAAAHHQLNEIGIIDPRIV